MQEKKQETTLYDGMYCGLEGGRGIRTGARRSLCRASRSAFFFATSASSAALRAAVAAFTAATSVVAYLPPVSVPPEGRPTPYRPCRPYLLIRECSAE